MADARANWTEERESTLRHMWSSGVSAPKIARQLGTSRGAILSKAKRLGIENTSIIKNSRPVRPAGSLVRDGQSDFRSAVLNNFSGRCAITATSEPRSLQACHIIPYSAGGKHDLRNALALRADIHSLFDCGLLTICAITRSVKISASVCCHHYRSLDGRSINFLDCDMPPSRTALAWHNLNVFRPPK